MKNLTKRSQKTIEQLKAKGKSGYKTGARMPSLKLIAQLLEEFKIEHRLEEWSEWKTTKPAGYRYTTGGGTKEYTGYRLKFTATFNERTRSIEMNSTETYYSYNTSMYAREILEALGIEFNMFE